MKPSERLGDFFRPADHKNLKNISAASKFNVRFIVGQHKSYQGVVKVKKLAFGNITCGEEFFSNFEVMQPHFLTVNRKEKNNNKQPAAAKI